MLNPLCLCLFIYLVVVNSFIVEPAFQILFASCELDLILPSLIFNSKSLSPPGLQSSLGEGSGKESLSPHASPSIVRRVNKQYISARLSTIVFQMYVAVTH